MNYFIDTEFLEGPQRESFPISLFREFTKPTIDLISIGIAAADGREFYRVSNEFNLKEAWNRFDIVDVESDEFGLYTERKYWIRDNVLLKIWRQFFFWADSEYSMLSNKQSDAFHRSVMAGDYDRYFTYKSLKALVKKYGVSNKQIAEEIKEFVFPCKTDAKFHAYYADYDWVGFCWLFGKMINLPKGFPMYCVDLKQMLDEKVEKLEWLYCRDVWSNKERSVHTIGTGDQQEKDRPAEFNEKLEVVKQLKEYPVNENEHHALNDAKFDMDLYEFIRRLK